MTQQTSENMDTPRGLAFAVTAYLLWGFLPLYMKALSHIPAAEIVTHRVIWSVPVAGALLIILRRTKDLRAALKNPRMLGMACITAALISMNWGIYVWSIAAGRALDAALGYYINPLFSIALGALLLREPLSKAQLAAVALAAAAVVVLTLEAGRVPWVAVSLTLTWGFYAFFKKSLPIGPNQGFLLEVLILLPPALGYFGYLTVTGNSNIGASFSDTALLLGCGIV
ncbi:MAG: EamA family transporter RarD, partial [Leisingera sp.]